MFFVITLYGVIIPIVTQLAKNPIQNPAFKKLSSSKFASSTGAYHHTIVISQKNIKNIILVAIFCPALFSGFPCVFIAFISKK